MEARNYLGCREGGRREILVVSLADAAKAVSEGREIQPWKLRPRFDLLLPSDAPGPYEWGHYGAGARILAATLLADVLCDSAAREWTEQFARCVIAHLPYTLWHMDTTAIAQIVARFEEARQADFDEANVPERFCGIEQ